MKKIKYLLAGLIVTSAILTPGNSFGIKHVEVLGMKANYKIKVIYDDELKDNNVVEDVINTF